jgi:hypothetical protein
MLIFSADIIRGEEGTGHGFEIISKTHPALFGAPYFFLFAAAFAFVACCDVMSACFF